MGMESFRVDMVWDSGATMAQIIDCLKTRFSVEPNRYIYRKFFLKRVEIIKSEFWVNSYVLAYFFEEKKHVSFTACFSNFEKNIETYYDIFCLLQKQQMARIAYGDWEVNGPISYNEFKEKIMAQNNEKYKIFREKYTLIGIDMRPGDEFYKRISNTGGGSMCRRL